MRSEYAAEMMFYKKDALKRKPEIEHLEKEICFAYNEDSLTIVDVTDHSNPIEISRTEYVDSVYTHQGWLTDDHSFLLLNDELDSYYEMYGGCSETQTTRTLIWNLEDLDAPVYNPENDYCAPVKSFDHNLYIKGDYAYLGLFLSIFFGWLQLFGDLP